MFLYNKWLSFLIILGLVAIMLPEKSHAGCLCKAKGTDYCAGCSNPLVVRPKQRNTDGNPDIDLAPIGDSCWCTKKMIEPAVLPKPIPKKKSCNCGSSCKCGKSCGCGKSSSSSSSHDSEASIFQTVGSSSSYVRPDYVRPAMSEDDSLPADPISVSLAIQADKAIEVPEAKLSYGFVQKPIDEVPKVYFSSVKEENLYALNNDVITLKKYSSNNRKNIEEYIDMDDEETLNGDTGNIEDDDEPRRLTYRQLGYVAEQYKNPKFKEVDSSSYYSSSSDSESRKVSVDCGYRPGRITTKCRSKQRSYDLEQRSY